MIQYDYFTKYCKIISSLLEVIATAIFYKHFISSFKSNKKYYIMLSVVIIILGYIGSIIIAPPAKFLSLHFGLISISFMIIIYAIPKLLPSISHIIILYLICFISIFELRSLHVTLITNYITSHSFVELIDNDNKSISNINFYTKNNYYNRRSSYYRSYPTYYVDFIYKNKRYCSQLNQYTYYEIQRWIKQHN